MQEELENILIFFTGQNGFNDYQEQPQPVYEPLPEQELMPPQYPDEKEIYNQYAPGQIIFLIWWVIFCKYVQNIF